MENISAGLLALNAIQENNTPQTNKFNEAFFNRMKAINDLADKKSPIKNNTKPLETTTAKTPEKIKPTRIVEDNERQIKPIHVDFQDIKAATIAEKIGVRKELITEDKIEELLSGKRPKKPIITETYIDPQIKTLQNGMKLEDNYIPELLENKSNNNNLDMEKLKIDIKQYVNEQVTNILFNEIFNPSKIKALMESVFEDVIEKRAKQILVEALKNKKK